MQTIALHTRLKAGREAEYERVHAVIPPDLDAALREAGVHEWRIWRDGQDLFHRFDPSSTGPDVLAWAEWNDYRKTGDRERLEMVFAPLAAYHQWLRAYRTWPDGSYWTTGWGCGMDNQPRVDPGEHVSWSHSHRAWVDATFQAILSARCLFNIAQVLGVEVGYFFEGLQSAPSTNPSPRQRVFLELARNFMSIRAPRHQEAICLLTRILANLESTSKTSAWDELPKLADAHLI